MEKRNILFPLIVGLVILSAAPLFAVDCYWMADAAGDFSTGSNWSGATCPGTGDVAIFDGAHTGDCNLDTTVNVDGLKILTGYTGTITQGGNPVVTGNTGYTQEAGAFSGSTGNIEIDGPFSLSGGTFTSTSALLQIGDDQGLDDTVFSISGTGSFNHNSGTIRFTSGGTTSTHIIDVNVSETFYNLAFASQAAGDENETITYAIASGDTLTVNNNFEITRIASAKHRIRINGGTIDLKGNITRVDKIGDGGTTLCTLTGTSDQTYVYCRGRLPRLEVDKSSTSVLPVTGSACFSVSSFELTQGSFTAPAGDMCIGNDSTGTLNAFIISAGTTFTQTSGTLRFDSSGALSHHTIDVDGSLDLNNLVLSGGNAGGDPVYYDIASGDTLTVNGDFTMDTSVSGSRLRADGGTIDIKKHARFGGEAGGQDLRYFGFLREITVDHTLVSEDLEDYPMLFTVTDPLLKTTGSGGNVQHANGYDIVFTDNTGVRLDHEIETYDGVNGVFKAWVRIPSLSSSADTTILLYYGNSGISVSQENVPGVWADYIGVWHLNETTGGVDSLKDSTGNGNHGTDANGVILGAGGKIGNGVTFDGSDDHIDCGTGVDLTLPFTISAWVNINSFATGNVVVKTKINATSYYGAWFSVGTGQTIGINYGDGTGEGSGDRRSRNSESTLSGTGVWHHIAGTVTGSTNMALYIDGMEAGGTYSGTGGSLNNGTGLSCYMGEETNYGSVMDGTIDELRISKTARSEGWIQTCSNNQNAPSSFCSVSAEKVNYGPCLGGTTDIVFSGTDDQTFAGPFSLSDGAFTINKSSGSLMLMSDMNLNYTGQDLTVTAGVLYAGSGSLSVDGTLDITGTLIQGSGSLYAGTLSVSGEWRNHSVGDITVGPGGVSSSGTVSLHGGGGAGGSDEILIRSSEDGTQRSWTGTGYDIVDTDVKDQGGTAVITAYHSTNTGTNNGANWTFNGSDPLDPNVWEGDTDSYWSTGANWSKNAVPNSGQVAVFNSSSSVNCTIDAVADVAGIDIQSGYTGTITQDAGITVTAGSSGYTQSGGIFSGGDAAITVSGSMFLSGGSFKSTSGTLTVKNDFLTAGSPVFIHNEGTVQFGTGATEGDAVFSGMTAGVPSGKMGYEYSKKITVDHTKVDSDLGNFPMLFSKTDPVLATTANGGMVSSTNGYDIIFVDENENRLDHEIEKYDGATGEFVAWVRIPILLSTEDTVLYICYGNSGVSSSQENAQGVWNESYKGVWHMNENAADTAVLDSTGVNSGNAVRNTDQVSTAGQIGGALIFDGTADYIDITDGSNCDFTSESFSIFAWVYPNSDDAGIIYDNRYNIAGTDKGWLFGLYGSGKVDFDINGGGDNSTTLSKSGAYAGGSWQQIGVVKEGTTGYFYVNGDLVDTKSLGSSGTVSYASFYYHYIGMIGGSYAGPSYGLPNRYMDGSLDELRISSSARSSAWISTSYTNQHSPSEFYTYGTESDRGILFNNVVFNKGTGDKVVLAGSIGLIGDLTLTSVDSTITGGTIKVAGDITSTDTDISGSASLTFTGSEPHTLTANGADLPDGPVGIEKTAPQSYWCEHGTALNVKNTEWTTVNLQNTYASMVVICTPNYDNTQVPLVVRLRNAQGSDFQVKVDRADGLTAEITGIDVHYFVVEEGIYTTAEHGLTMEAVKYTSTITDHAASWVGETQTYQNTYTNPVVVGQVMTYNDTGFSVFWCAGATADVPPSNTDLITGKTVCEDTETVRSNEVIGYVVVEAGTGTMDGIAFSAQLGTEAIGGMDDSPPDTYTISVTDAAGAVVSQAGMGETDGGWAVLYGANPVTDTTLDLCIDEDKITDLERNHAVEQAGYIVFGASSRESMGTVSLGSHVVLDGAGQDMNIQTGVFDMGGYSLTVPGTVSVSGILNQGAGNLNAGGLYIGSLGLYTNHSTGDCTLGGYGVVNYGAVNIDSSGNGCGDSDTILIRSDVIGTQRLWAGSGVFSIRDADVQDQAADYFSIYAYDSTDSGNNNFYWYFFAPANTNVWLGGTGVWNTGANWSLGTVPDSTNIAIFSSASSVDCTIDADVDVKGIEIQSGYTGCITQESGYTVTVGESGYFQDDGTFKGGNSNITIGGIFRLSHGTFRATAATTAVGFENNSYNQNTRSLFTVSESAVFNHNSGTLELNPKSGSGSGIDTFLVDVPDDFTLYNVTVNCNDNNDFAIIKVPSGTGLTVCSIFTLRDGMIEGTWDITGDIAVESDADGGTGVLMLTGGDDQTCNVESGSVPLAWVVDKRSGIVSASGSYFNASTFTISRGEFSAPAFGTMEIGFTNSKDDPDTRTLFNIYGGAVFNHNDGEVVFNPASGQDSGVDAFIVDVDSVLDLYDVTINCDDTYNPALIEIGSEDLLRVNNDLTVTDGMIGDTWEVMGDVTVGAGADGGAASLMLTGSGDQTWTDNGGTPPSGAVYISKYSGLFSTAGTAVFPGAVILEQGTFTPGMSTTFNGGLTVESGGIFDCSVAGSVITVQAGDTVVFDEGSWLRINGTSGSPVQLASSSAWYLTMRGSYDIHYADVSWSDASAARSIYAYNSSGVNTVNWFFSDPAATATWDGSDSDDWNNPANWNLGRTPMDMDHVIVPDSGVTNEPNVPAGTYTYKSLTVGTGRTVTCRGNTEAINEPSGGTGSVPHGTGVAFNITGNVTVDGTLSANAQGFPGCEGPGVGANGSRGAGGGYGGYGGNGYSAIASRVRYGSFSQPTALGSGGGWTSAYSVAGGSGGGAITISTPSGTVTLNGTVTCNGGTGGSNAAGGSGGSIWISADTLAGGGAGYISAKGASPSGSAGGGGGGRIALDWTTDNTFAGTISAYGPGSGYYKGHSGTLSIPDGEDMTVNGDVALPPGTYNIPYLTVTNNAMLECQGDNDGNPVNGSGVIINATDVTVDSGAQIYAYNLGFAGAEGPGVGSSGTHGAGAGHGGKGGNGAGSTGGPEYGSATEPIELGSGGGYSGEKGNPGGGAVKINASGTVTINGTVNCRGAAPSGGHRAGGSGGSVWITSSILTGTGKLRVDGANGSGGTGGGAGGRIALHAGSYDSILAAVSITGGTAQYGDGEPGTIVYAPIGGYDNDNVIPTSKCAQSPNGDGVVSIAFKIKDPGDRINHPCIYDAEDTRVFDNQDGWGPGVGTEGYQGNMHYTDANGNRTYDTDEDVWLDNVTSNGQYDTGETQVHDGSDATWTTTDGTVGRQGYICFDNTEGDKAWDVGEDVWLDIAGTGIMNQNHTLKSFSYSVDGGGTWSTPDVDTAAYLTGGWPDNSGSKFTGDPSFGPEYTFTWDSAHGDLTGLDGVEQNDVRIRFKLDDNVNSQHVSSVSYAVSENFIVDNKDPVGLASLAVSSIDVSTASLTWTAATDTYFGHYEIWYGTNLTDVQNRTGTAAEWDDDNDTNLTSAGTGSTTITGLTWMDIPYYFKIWAVDAYGNEITTAYAESSTNPTVNFTQVSQSGTEDSVGTMTVTCSLDVRTGVAVVVPYTVNVGSTAIRDTDYSLSPETPDEVVIPGGGLSANLTITVAPDGENENDETVIIDMGTPDYANKGTTDQHTATILDDDNAGITVNPTSGLITTEGGGTDTFDVVLECKPTASVTIDITSSDPGEGTVSAASITFTTANWDTPQTITVTGVDDGVQDGDIGYTIVLDNVQSTDTDYSVLDPDDVSVTNQDDDVVGVTVNPTSGLVTTEDLGTDTFTVVLNTPPTDTVTIPVSSGDPGEGTVSPSPLTFATGNWDTPQTVTVTGVDDEEEDGDIAYTVTVGPASSTGDTNYDGFDPDDVSVINKDNDLANITLTPLSGLVTTEGGGTDTFDVVLNSKPSADVTISVTSSDTGEGTVSAPSLTFTDTDWDMPQTVTVTGADDALTDGDIVYSIQLGPATSTDADYDGFEIPDAVVTNIDDDTPGITVHPVSGLVTTEGGGTDTFTVVLNSLPSADVTVTVVSLDTGEGTASPSSLVFTPGNWGTAQTVTVTGQDDGDTDGNILYTVQVGPASSTDTDYNGMEADDVSVTNMDDDTPGVTVNPISGLVTTEGEGTDSFTVVLDTQPSADVTIDITSSDPGEGTVSAASITFTTANWDTPQTITVTGVDDISSDGNVVYTIQTGPITSTDTDYSAINPDDVSVTNSDDDEASITVSRTSGLETTEGTGTDSFTIVLNTEPTAGVTINLSSSDPGEGTVSPASITFTDSTWNNPRTIVVTGVDDDVDDGDIGYTVITGAATSTDLSYDGKNPPDVSVTNYDNDTAGATAYPSTGLVTGEDGTSDTFTVVLRSEPTASVTINVASLDTTEGTVSAGSLVFTTGDWNVPQQITVTGENDGQVDGDIGYTVELTASSSDSVYDGIAVDNVSLTNIDDDTPGVTVNPTTGLFTTEAGGTDTFTVVLDTQPGADVSIDLSSSDLSEGTVSPSSLTFTDLNWNTPQTVTVTGVDDDEDDGDVAYTVVTSSTTSGDVNYEGLAVDDVSVTNNDNDEAGVTVTLTSGLVTTEGGGTDTFDVFLNCKPLADVTIDISSSDTTEGTASPALLTFTSGNWNTPQTVTVTGADDDINDGDIPYTVITSPTSSGDGNFNGLAVDDVSVTNNDDDVPGVTVTPTTGRTTTEAGGTDTFTVVLDCEPGANVTIDISSSDITEGTVSPASLTFTPANWDTAQTVTVTGVDDDIIDGDIGYTAVTAAASSTDTDFQGINPSDVSVTNTDDDTADVTVTPTSGLVTTEAGGTDTFDVVLECEPGANVTIAISSSDVTEGTISPASLTFTPGNWDIPQAVTVTGVDDDEDDGDIGYSVITGACASTDGNYSGLAVDDVSVTNTDNDAAGVTVDPTAGLVTTEGGGTDTFDVVLDSKPSDDVTISITSLDLGEGTVSHASLTFTDANWNIPQTVTVFGQDDALQDGNILFTVETGAASSTGDTNYDGLAVDDISVTNIDDDQAGITVSPVSGLVTTEGGGTDTFDVVLNSAPTDTVTIPVSSADPGEGTALPAPLTFTTGNWGTPQTVTVTGVDDDEEDGDIAFTITVGPASSIGDTNYDGLDPDDVSVTNKDNDIANITVTPLSGLMTTESGGTDTFDVVLDTQPSADVTISVASSDSSEGSVSPSSLTFTTGDWDTPQTVTVTGADDALADGNIPYSVQMGPASSTDMNYNGLAVSDASLINIDDETPGVTVHPVSGLITTEGGGTDTFDVVLNSQPSSDVTISITSLDLGEGTVSDASLTFTDVNWNIPQTVTVIGQDDGLSDGNISFAVELGAASSTDTDYDSLEVDDVSVTNLDDDTVGVTVTPTGGLVTTEGAGKDTFTVVLNSLPSANVTISVSSSDTGEGTASTSLLTFTTGDWDTPQTVTVTGADDALADGDVSYSIQLGPASSGDANYNSLPVDNVSLINIDDETAGVTVRPTSGLETSEAGGTDTFTVVLNSQPSADVTISISSSDTNEGTVSPASLTFTSSNWNSQRTVTVTGADDDVNDGDTGYSVITGACASTDGNYSGLAVDDVSVTNTDNDAAGVTVTPTSGLVTTEAGDTATFTVVLHSEPTADVSIDISSSNINEGTVSPLTLTFTAGNWNTPQTVTVTGVDDFVIDGDIGYTALTSSSSSDSDYNSIAVDDVSVTNNDNDTAGITVTPTSGLITSEAGGTDTFTVVLDCQPGANVTVDITSLDPGEGTVSDALLTFTSSNWDTPQTVTVTGQDDAIQDGNIAYTVQLNNVTSGGDPDFDGIAVDDVSATNTDDDSAGITVTPVTGLITTEAGMTDTFTVVLNTQPTDDVTIPVSSTDTGEGTVSPASLTFTSANWDTSQTVTVTGVDDQIKDGNIGYTVTLGAATSTDANYDAVDPSDVSVTNNDDDTASVTVTPTSGLITSEAGGTDTFDVVLDSQPGANVTIPVNSSDTSEGTVSPSLLTFTPSNWNTEQTVTVTGQDDALQDGHMGYSIHLGPTSSIDPNYDNVSISSVSVTNNDNDTAGITVSPVSGLITTEGGGTDTFDVVLDSQPAANVTIDVTSLDPGEGAVSASLLTFTSGNWDIPQTVTVTGQDDGDEDGNISYTIQLNNVTSTDSNYNGIAVSDVSALNVENEMIDADGDGLHDLWEQYFSPDRDGDDTTVTAAELDDFSGALEWDKDYDWDGLTDQEEYNLAVYPAYPIVFDPGSLLSASDDTGTDVDPTNSDTDRDGIIDGHETDTGVLVDNIDTGSSPVCADTDSDGLPDGWEVGNVRYGPWTGAGPNGTVDGGGDDISPYLDPNSAAGNNGSSADPDGDGYTNIQEYDRNTDPTDGGKYDADNDGMDDSWETAKFGDTSRDGTGDEETDGVTDLEEYLNGADPNTTDTDSDGVSDDAEIHTHGSDPDDTDTDNDGYTDGDEVNTHGTDPTEWDTDHDGMPDNWELDNSLDPFNDDSLENPDGDSWVNLEEYRNGTDPNLAPTVKKKSGGGGGGCMPSAGNTGFCFIVLMFVAGLGVVVRKRNRSDFN